MPSFLRNTLLGPCVVALASGLVLSGCSTAAYQSYELQEVMGALSGDPVMDHAMMHGCISATWSRANPFYGTFTKPTYDPYLAATTDIYSTFWFRLYVYCFQNAAGNSYMAVGEKQFKNYDNRWIEGVGLSMTSPGEASRTAMQGDLNRGLPGVDNYSDPVSGDMFGIFGNCAFC